MNFYNIIVVYCLIFRPKLKHVFIQYIFNREFVNKVYYLYIMEKKNPNPINLNNYHMIGQILKLILQGTGGTDLKLGGASNLLETFYVHLYSSD